MLTQMSSARELATRAHEMGAFILRGELARCNSDWTVDGRSVTEWLADLEGQQVFLIAIAPDAKSEPVVTKRTCRTCGRDYEGDECQYCRQVRIRLRGR